MQDVSLQWKGMRAAGISILSKSDGQSITLLPQLSATAEAMDADVSMFLHDGTVHSLVQA